MDTTPQQYCIVFSKGKKTKLKIDYAGESNNFMSPTELSGCLLCSGLSSFLTLYSIDTHLDASTTDSF